MGMKVLSRPVKGQILKDLMAFHVTDAREMREWKNLYSLIAMPETWSSAHMNHTVPLWISIARESRGIQGSDRILKFRGVKCCTCNEIRQRQSYAHPIVRDLTSTVVSST